MIASPQNPMAKLKLIGTFLSVWAFLSIGPNGTIHFLTLLLAIGYMYRYVLFERVKKFHCCDNFFSILLALDIYCAHDPDTKGMYVPFHTDWFLLMSRHTAIQSVWTVWIT